MADPVSAQDSPNIGIAMMILNDPINHRLGRHITISRVLHLPILPYTLNVHHTLQHNELQF
jgi:hypothetical protein